MVLLPLCCFGFLGAIICGYLVKRLKVKKKFKTIFIANSIMMDFVIVFILYCFLYESYWGVFFSYGAFGFFATPMVALSLEYSCIISFPVGEALTVGILQMSG